MAFTKIVGAGIHTLSNVHTHNINSSGIITATQFVGIFTGTDGNFSGDLDVGGNVSIGGSLTVNGDFTTLNTTLREVEILNVDANSSAVAGIITQRGSGDILNLYDNNTEVFSVKDGGDVIAGVGDLAIHTGSRRRLAITDTANGALLHIRGQSPAVFFDQSGGNIGKIYQDNADLAIYAGRPDSEDTNTVRIDSSGRVLIGGTSNSASSHADELQIINTSAQGGLSIINASDGQGNIYFGHSGGTADGRIEYSHQADYMRFFTANEEKVRIVSGGNVGIGTNNPAKKLEVFDATQGVIRIRGGGGGSDTSRKADLSLFASGAREYVVRADASDAAFKIVDVSGSNAERFVINSSGNVGINSTAPRGKLDIKFPGAPSFITFGADADNPKMEWFRSTGGSPSHYATEIQMVLGDLVLSTAATANLGSHSYSEKLRINSGGRVIIGHSQASGDLHGPQGTTGRNPFIQLHGANTSGAGLGLISWKNSAGAYYAPSLFLAHSGSDTKGTNGILPANGEFGSIVFSGDDGTDFVKGAMIKARLDGSPGNDNMPGRLEFYTNSGSDSPTERLRITAAGFVQIGAAADAAEAPLHVTAENSQGINAIFGAKDFIVNNNYNYDDANIALQGRDADNNDTGAGIQFTTRNTGNSNWLHGAFTQDTSGHFRFITGGAGTTAGTTKVTITSGGKVGINEPNPSAFLTVRATTDDNPSIVLYRHSGGGDVASLNWKSSSGTNAFIKWRGGSGDMGMHFYTSNAGNDGNTSEKIRITSTGQLLVHTGSNASGSIVMGGNYDGLGQTNSTAKLGTLMMPHYTNAEEPIQIIRGYSDSARNLVSIGGGTNSANAATEIELLTASSITGNGVARLSIGSDGRAVFSARTRTVQLGIGAVAQDYVHLHVESTDPRVLIKSSGTNASKIWFGDSGGTDRGIIEYQHTNDAMRFGSAGVEDRLVIKGDGKIAIGAPAFTAGSLLHVKGSGAYLTLEGTAGTDYQGISIKNSGGNNGQLWFQGDSQTGYGGANSLNLYNNANNPIAFWQATNKRGELASTGNWVLYTSLYASTSSSTINGNGALMGKLGNKSLGSDVWGAGKGTTQFYIYGDSDKYYPVEIFPAGSAWNTRIQVWRGYSEHGPNDWYTSTHKGGLTFDFSVRFGSWGGYTTHGPQIYYFGESYATLVGGLAYISHSQRYCIWLRGGGSGGARYNIDSPSGNLSFIVYDDVTNTGTGQGYYYSSAGTAGEGNNGNTARGWSTYYHSNAGYRYYVDYIGNSTTLNTYRNNTLKPYNLTGAHTTHSGGAHNP